MTPLTQFERRLKVLETEVNLDFPGFLQSLKDGMQVVVITKNQLARSLEPDHLRRIGGMVSICNHYGVVVVFVGEKRIGSWGEPDPSPTS